MQLANGCGSGVLFAYGSGSGRMIYALPGFIIGSVVGSLILPIVLDWGALNPVIIGWSSSLPIYLMSNLFLIFSIVTIFFTLALRSGRKLSQKVLLGLY